MKYIYNFQFVKLIIRLYRGNNMQITVIHGQSRKGSTYHIAHRLAEKLNGEITKIFLPKDFGEFCVGWCIALKKECFQSKPSAFPPPQERE